MTPTKQQALLLLRQGRLSAAKSLLETVLRTAGGDAGAWYMLAAVNHRLGMHEAAARCYEACIALDPNHPEAPYYLGNVYGETGDHEHAIENYRRALRLKPAFPEAALNLGASLQGLDRTQEAVDVYQQFLQHSAGSADIHFNLGNAFADLGDPTQAIASYERAVSIAPQRPELYLNLGHALDEDGQLDQAVRQYETALSLDPSSIPAYRSLGACLAEQGQPEAALACYRRGLEAAPDAGLKLRIATMLPAIPASLEDLTAWRERFDAELARLEHEPIELAAPLAEVGAPNFYLSYHGLNNRALHARVAALHERACPSLRWTAPHCAGAAPGRGKLRIGFVSRYLHNHSIGKTTRGLVAKLPREQFEVISLFVPPCPDDQIARFIRSNSSRSVVLPHGLESARRAIADLGLDILFYQDIGMEPFTYFLAFSRLAPVQCTSFGHPDTTGIANMDYFVSSTLFEPAHGHEHYSEELFLLQDVGTLAYYYRPQPPAGRVAAADFGLPDANLYLCPQTLFKVHPEFDALLGAILRADPSGRLVLIEGTTRNWGRLLRERFVASIPDVADRVIFLPRQRGADFTRLVGLSCVMLDTPHFNGMNTSLEAFSVGTPVVTLPTSLQRGRHTAAMYRKMGFTECVAAGQDDYVKIAVRLAADEEYRSHVKGEILRRNDALFEDMRVVTEFERFFLESAALRGRQP